MAGVKAVVLVVLLATAIGAFANDPDMLQDVCVANTASGIIMCAFLYIKELVLRLFT